MKGQSFSGKNNLPLNLLASRKSAGSTFNARTLGASFGATHQSTVPMQFHGQDAKSKSALGHNPNQSVEDEYISNLQQQIHFMELELKILKEKVVEDEKKSGIGSLFDDEKSSFQHISLLKQKYTKMRREYDRKLEELNKFKLAVIGEQFVLDSQINIMLAQNQKIEDQQKDYNQGASKRHFEVDRELKEVSKQRLDSENDLRQQENEFGRESADNYSNKMTIEKDKEFEALDHTRHTLDVKLQGELLEAKKEEKKKFQDDRGQVQAQFEAHVELQKCLAESADLRNTIENAGIKLDLLQIGVKELEDVTEYLNNKKDELLEQRKLAEIKNEELRKELVAKEDIAAKRLQAKLNRDKNVEVKELIAQEETAVQHNQELIGKLDEEKKKYEGLLDEKLEIDEHLRVATKDMEETKAKLADQDAFITDLKAKIEVQTKTTEELNTKTEEERKVNKLEEERFRKLGQMNAALRAKLEFIQSKYDFTTNIKVLNTDDFNSLVSTNNIVNETMGNFMDRLKHIKVEIDKYDAMKEAF